MKFFRHIMSSIRGTEALLPKDEVIEKLSPVAIICKAYSMPKTATVILAFIANPTTTKEDIFSLCEQISIVYDNNVKVAKVVSDAVKALYEACVDESFARTVYSKVEEIAASHKIVLDQPLFMDMLAYKANPISGQYKRQRYRMTVPESSVS